jgi:hypothetical protein
MTASQSRVFLVLALGLAGLFCAAVESSGQDFPASPQEQLPSFTEQDLEFFESKVRPLLVQNCNECHGLNSDPREGGLLTSSRKALLRGGDTGPAIKPGDPDSSLLVEVVNYDGDIAMPPNSKLPQEQINILTEWVKRGAPWPAEDDHAVATESKFDLAARRSQHWCWQPIRRGNLPAVRQQDWVLDPLDQFILARLEQAKLLPAAPASKTSWIRRVTFDLTGLPPGPADIQAFLDDKSPQAYQKVVDRLLDSPHFGERWARHWMDLVRYAETCGHEFDYPIPGAHHYRDYLIRSFNADVPYDQFVREHIAGDLLTNPRRHPESKFNESIIGTGFWFLGEATHAPVDVRGDEAGRIDNQLDVMSKTFLGVTLACARCHDHKFDAISTQDYYAASGFMQSSRRQEALLDPGLRIQQGLDLIRQTEQQVSNKLSLISTEETLKNQQKQWRQELTAVAEIMRELGGIDLQAHSPFKLEESVDLLLTDFEDGTYGDWQTTGTAFGSRPQSQETLADYQGNVRASGKYFVNSHSRSQAEGGPSDDATGTLTSPAFKLDRRFLHFLVGGGNHTNKTCVQILVDDKPVLSQTGFAQNEMRPVVLDLANWIDKDIRIRLVDEETGGWGNIGADFFVLSHSRHIGMPRTLIHEVAKRHGVSADRLEMWILALKEVSKDDFAHPAQPLAAVILAETPEDESWKTQNETFKRKQSQSESNPQQNTILLDTADPDSRTQWFLTGQAFPEKTPEQGNWQVTDRGWRYAAAEHLNSERHGSRLYGVVRSPTFTIESDRIWYRLKTRNANVRLVIDGFTMNIYNGLLFSQCSKNFNTEGKWQWVEQSGDMGRYKGHRAHIEIIDHGNEGFELSEIQFGNNPSSTSVDPVVSRTWSTSRDADSLYNVFASEMAAAWQACLSGKGTGSQSKAVNWLLDQGLVDFPAKTAAELQTLAAECQQKDRELPAPLRVQALAEGTGENEKIFIRGNHRLLGEVAPRQMLTALQTDPWPEDFVGSGRLRLANEIVDPKNPLTSRVMINRIWHHLFGRGIVPSVDNFGVLGQEPTHPELLDYLAAEFMDQDWSIKQMIKRIVLSQTYRLSSQGVAESDQQDPQNLLWHRAHVRRLQGEAIRDSMLTASGRLDPTLFGPSVPIHLTEFLSGRGRPGNGPLDGNRRRSLYLEVRRNFLQPMMISFDTPIPFSTVGRRNTSNVPAQALILMNDPFVYEEAKHFAERLLAESDAPADRIEKLYLLSFGRRPDEGEVEQAIAFVESQGTALGLTPEAASKDLRPWQDLCHVIWNAKEFTYLN